MRMHFSMPMFFIVTKADISLLCLVTSCRRLRTTMVFVFGSIRELRRQRYKQRLFHTSIVLVFQAVLHRVFEVDYSNCINSLDPTSISSHQATVSPTQFSQIPQIPQNSTNLPLLPSPLSHLHRDYPCSRQYVRQRAKGLP